MTKNDTDKLDEIINFYKEVQYDQKMIDNEEMEVVKDSKFYNSPELEGRILTTDIRKEVDEFKSILSLFEKEVSKNKDNSLMEQSVNQTSESNSISDALLDFLRR